METLTVDGRVLAGSDVHYRAGYHAGWKAASDFFTGKGMGFEHGKAEMAKWDDFFADRKEEIEAAA